MSNNPFLNALTAALYIVCVATIINFAPKAVPGPDSVLTPVFVLSLFVLSAAVMGYLFLGKPLQMYLDGQKKEAVRYFMHTVASFAALTLLSFIALYLWGAALPQ
jgi:hypothetical protein